MPLRTILLLFLFAVTTNAQFGYQQRTPTKPPDVTIAVSADGQTLAIARSSGGRAKRYGRVELWNIKTRERQRTITGFDGPIWSVTFSKDGKSLMTISTEYRDSKIQSSIRNQSDTVKAELKWWDAQSGEFVKKLPLGEEGVWFVEAGWSPAGDEVALVEHYGRGHYMPTDRPGVVSNWVSVQELHLRLLDAKSGERRVKVESSEQTYSNQITYIGRMARPVYSTDGKLLAAVSGNDVLVWDVATGKKTSNHKKAERNAESDRIFSRRAVDCGCRCFLEMAGGE